MDAAALRDFGVEDFSSMLRWAMREEAAEAAAQRRRSRRNWSRKKARLRCAPRRRAPAVCPRCSARVRPAQLGCAAGGPLGRAGAVPASRHAASQPAWPS